MIIKNNGNLFKTTPDKKKNYVMAPINVTIF